MKKKILSLVLALLMASSSAALVAADETDAVVDETPVVTATEEEEESPYAYAVEFLYNYGIYKGTSASDLATEDDIQRYQMALFVSRISTGWVDDEKWEDGPQNSSIFSDVEEGAASNFLGAISYANQKGIIEGYGNGKFGPYDGITYQNALTMVVRTLGYQGLDWPWGYIERAIELGLTEGITDVAYTDVLTRGEVAQIIYNAMFATTKSGSTLALENFGIEFGWEPIVITASDVAVYEKDGALSGKDQNNEDQKIVSFKLYNDDGTVDTGKDAVTYYATAASLGLDADKHEDELAVGTTMWVFFEKDADSNLVKIIDYRTNTVDTVWNMGKTDDEGVEQSYAIKDYLEDYTLVSKYTPVNYVGATKRLKPEIIVYNALAELTVETVDAKYGDNLAIDWTTGDILVPCKKDDADYTVKDGDVESYYKIAWIYNSTYDSYYRYKKDATDKTVIGIEWLTDAKLEKTYEEAYNAVKTTKTVKGFNVPDTGIKKDTAYASLALEDVDLDGVAERGIYEEYGLGYFSVSEKKCGKCDKKYPSYKIDKVTADVSASSDVMNGKGTILAEVANEYSAKPCNHVAYYDVAWFAEGYEPTKDEDGAYLNGYVIYSYDATTKEIKIVKDITNGDDVDSYVATGVLRAYSPAKKTVTIGETVYPTAYDELKNTGFYKVADNKTKYTAGLYSMFNQYVQYVVVDGEVVAMNLKGETTTNYLVVKGYAGKTNDGYIAVDAYSTASRTLGTYCIGSYNGWKQGDYYYYLTEEKVRDSFTPGTIYYIKSYDDVNDVYYVELVGEYDKDNNYTVDGLSLKTMTLKFAEDGYREIWVDGKKDSEAKMKSDDKYIILAPNVYGDKAPIFVYEGKVSDTNWTVEGDRVTTIGDNVFVMVNVTDVRGFVLDSYQSGMVLYEGGKVLEAGYDAAVSEGSVSAIVKDRYLLGASTTTVEVLDLYTGKRDAVIVDRNINLKKNHIYVTVSGQVVEEVSPWADSEISMTQAQAFVAWMKNYFYQDTNANDRYAATADYLFGWFQLNIDQSKKPADAAKDLSKDLLNAQLVTDGYFANVRSRVDSITFYAATYKNDTMTVDYQNDLAKYIKDNPKVKAIECAYIYNVSNGKVVVYANESNTLVTETVKVPATLIKNVNDVVGVNVEQNYTFEVVKNAAGEIVEATLKDVEFVITGADMMGHNDRVAAGIGFGHMSDHFAGTYINNDKGNGLTMNKNILVDLYMNRNDEEVVKFDAFDCDENLCDIVKSIKFVNVNEKIDLTKDNVFGLRMTLKGDVQGADSAFALYSTVALSANGKALEATEGANETYTPVAPLYPVNPDGIQDAITVPVEVVPTADVTVD